MSSAAERQRRRRHVIRRARERWDAWITMEDLRWMNEAIRLGLGRPVEKRVKRRGRKLFVTTLDWKRLPVVYDDRLKMIVTVMPPEAKEVARYIERMAALSREGQDGTRA